MKGRGGYVRLPTEATPLTAQQFPAPAHAGGAYQSTAPLFRDRKRKDLWKANTVLLCNGKVVLGAIGWQVAAALFVLVGSWALLVGFLTPLMGVTLRVVSYALMVVATALYVLTAVVEPGIQQPQPKSVVSTVTSHLTHSAKKKLRICRTCNIVQKPRMHHCRVCNVCVKGFDHHCPWTGNCIGHRNYRFFYLFTLVASVGSGLLLAMSTSLVLEPSRWEDDDDEPLGYSITWAVVSALWFLILFLSVLPLFLVHTVLLWRDQTTDEFLKNIRRTTERKSCGEQCHAILFAPIPPSDFLPLDESQDERDVISGVEARNEIIAAIRQSEFSLPFENGDSPTQRLDV